MADINKLAQLSSGFVRNIDLTANTPVVLSIKVGGVTNTELTKAILDNLVNLQNGTDFSSGTNSHTHNGLYFTETEIGSSSASSGSDLVGDDATYSNFTPAAATVKGALSGIDTALGTVGDGKVKISSNDTTKDFLENKIVAANGTNTTNPLEISTLNDGGNEDLEIKFDQSKVDHGSIAGLGDDDHTIYTKADGTRAFTGDQSMGGNKLTEVGAIEADADLSIERAGTQALVITGNVAGPYGNGVTLKAADNASHPDIALRSGSPNSGAANTGGAGIFTPSPNANYNSGLIDLYTGSVSGTGNSGDIFVGSGDSVDGNTGNINIYSGTPSGSGTRGNVTLSAKQVSVSVADNLSMGSKPIINMADPSNAQDAATKAYVDGLLDGRKWKQSVIAATAAALPSYTGTGTLTASANGILDIDDVGVSNGDRILVKDETAGNAHVNGIYIVDDAGSIGTPWVITRSSDANTAAELLAASVFVEQGTVNADKQFSQTADNITLNTTAIVWALTSANSFAGHDMISLSGGDISVDLATVSGLESSNPGNAAGQLRIKLESSNPSLKIDGSNQLAAKLDAAGTITSGASGLTVGTDDTTIEKNANALRVKALGIGTSHIAADAVDKTKINADVAGNGLTQAVGGELDVAFAPLVKKSIVVGEAFAANTTFVVRYAINGETAGRLYKTDKDASSVDKFYAVGLVMSTSALSAADPSTMICLGTHTLGSSDSTFGASDIGKPVFLTAAGAFSLTAPSAANEAVTRIGIVEDTNKIFVQPAPVYVN